MKTKDKFFHDLFYPRALIRALRHEGETSSLPTARQAQEDMEVTQEVKAELVHVALKAMEKEEERRQALKQAKAGKAKADNPIRAEAEDIWLGLLNDRRTTYPDEPMADTWKVVSNKAIEMSSTKKRPLSSELSRSPDTIRKRLKGRY